ncbi:hypothetical protein VNO77_43205 [Canavalia gladiata]|uniref:J domain-containing protein n=1 Tax=Canavalia gladiata TaxID=3824 RepID=A0AAN9PP66_CANGL
MTQSLEPQFCLLSKNLGLLEGLAKRTASDTIQHKKHSSNISNPILPLVGVSTSYPLIQFPMPSTFNLSVLPARMPLGFASSVDRSAKFPRRTSIRAVAAEVIETRRPAASLYQVLRVEQNASPTEIKSAYRSLAKLYHPDAAVRRSPETNDGDFIEIRNAYETLSDPSARAMYDLSLRAAHCGRHRSFSSPLSRNRSSSGFYPTRRWETDQCW